MNTILRKLSLLLTLSGALLLAACGGGGGGAVAPAPAPDSGGTGTLGISLTDTPACGFDAVNVTVSKVRVHTSNSAGENDAGWAEIVLNPPRKINLLNLTNGVLDNLGQTPLPAGHYTQLRLVLVANAAPSTANSVVLSGTPGEIALVTPSAVQSGIKLIHEFDVAAGQRVDLVLDFDACKSVVARGNGSYALKPVIKVIPTVLNGINGYIATGLLGSGIAVTAQQNGTVIRSTVPNSVTGEFFLARLDPGNYDVVITGDARATAVIAAVPVPSTTSIVMVSTNAQPITAAMLPVSVTREITGTITLNPVNDTEAAYATAKQALVGGPIVTVKSVGADALSGDYKLVLPIGAPLLGQYGAGILPIALSAAAQGTVAGKYAVEASANGYTTQSVNKDISSAAASENFTLTPAP